MKNNIIHPIALRFADKIREKIRWTYTSHSSSPLVYYGQRHIPNRENLLSGGLVKLQDMITRFPNQVKNPNILYLISSALPPNPDILVHYAEKANALIILNQNGVAYPAWHGPGWEETNKRLASVYQQATCIIFQSEFCKISAQKFLGPTQAPNIISHNPVDIKQFIPPDMDKRPGDEVHLLVAGSHNFFYKVKTAIDTLSFLIEKGSKSKLQIAGRCCWEASEKKCLREIAAYKRSKNVKGQVLVTGAYTQQEAVAMFQKADILLHPTVNDSCPRLVVEAMACGTPIVYSATGGTPELVAKNAGLGIDGPLDWNNTIPPSPKKMAHAIEAVLKRYRYFSQGARNHAAHNFNVNDWLQKHEQIFFKLLSSDLLNKG